MAAAYCNLDFGRPGLREAYAITVLSLIAAGLFWINAIFDEIIGADSDSILSEAFESALDLFSTGIVLWRFNDKRSLEETPRNTVVEQRVSATLALVLLSLGALQVAVAGSSLKKGYENSDARELTFEFSLSLPASIVYLAIGIVQLQCGWALRVESLKQDAVISILGACTSIATLFASFLQLRDLAAAAENPQLANEEFRCPSIIPPTEDHWWVEHVLVLVISIFMIFYAMWDLVNCCIVGHKFWTCSFWCAELPPHDMVKAGPPDATASALAPGAGAPVREQSPLLTSKEAAS